MESDLKRHLAPVAAPDELWERLCERRAPRRRELYVPVWAAVAILFSVGAGALAWHGTSGPQASSSSAHVQTAGTQMLGAKLAVTRNLSANCLNCHTI
jgi:hypothetical protein